MEYLEGNFKLSKTKVNEILENMEISKEKIKQYNKNKKNIKNALKKGDTQLAIIISEYPLLIACYSDEFDSVIIYKYPNFLVGKYNLKVNDVLVTSNNYWTKGALDYADDIILGEEHSNYWRDIITYIPLFLCDDEEKVKQFTENRNNPSLVEHIKECAVDYEKERPGHFRDGFKTLFEI